MQHEADTRLKILNFNLQDFFLPIDYSLKEADLARLTEAEWQLCAAPGRELKALAKVRAIAALISELEPDLLCLTEVGGAKALHFFAENFLSGRYSAHLIEGQSERGIHNGFLLRKASGWRAALESHQDWPVRFTYPHEDDPAAHPWAAAAAPYHALGQASERRMSRDTPSLRLYRGSAVTPELMLLLVHLKSGFDQVGIDPAGRVRRTAEVKALVALYKELSSRAAVPLIVVGDFNGRAARAETAAEFLPLYRETDLEDALELAGRPQHERLSQFAFTKAGVIAQQLDYIFLPRALHARVVPEETYIYRFKFAGEGTSAAPGGEIMFPFSYRERNLLPSDHYPLLCTLELGKAATRVQ